jgi:VWFA-related protein
MLRTTCLLRTLALCLCLTGAGICARPQDEPPLAVETNAVSVPVVVRDGKNRPILDLKEADFRILQDGRPVEVVYFALDRSPVDVALLIDTSESIRTELGFLQESAFAFPERLATGDRVAVWSFSEKTREVLKLTAPTDQSALAAALRNLEAGGNTALYDAVVTVSKTFSDNRPATARQTRRNCIVLLTDGDDTASRGVTLDAAVTGALASDVSVYVVSRAKVLQKYYRDALSRGHLIAEDRLKIGVQVDRLKRAEVAAVQLAERTGGRALFPERDADLTKAYAEIATELHQRYNIGYALDSPSLDGKFHRLKVETRRRGLRVWAREGFFAR